MSGKNLEDCILCAKKAKSVAVITGAGISSESGIPTFRGDGGLWNNFRAEELATPAAFRKDPALVWSWYDWRRGICKSAKPNPAHDVISRIEDYYPEFLLITQNVDGLHGRAGSKNIVEIHGNIWKARCTSCAKIFEINETPLAEVPVKCIYCGSLSRPHIVWFGESYDSELLNRVQLFLDSCEFLLIIGTSGMVNIPLYLTEIAIRNGACVVEINPESSGISSVADYTIYEKAGEALPDLWDRIIG